MTTSNGQVARNDLSRNKQRTLLLSQAALLTALAYVGFQFFRIDIPVGAGKTAFHFGNVFVMLGALLIGGLWGGLSGAIGLTIADLTSGYAHAAPPTFILKFGIGLIVGLVAEKVLHLSKDQEAKNWLWKAALASGAGAVFNLLADPLVRMIWDNVFYGVPWEAAKILAKWGALTTLVNGVVAVIASTLLYLALRPALAKAGLFVRQD